MLTLLFWLMMASALMHGQGTPPYVYTVPAKHGQAKVATPPASCGIHADGTVIDCSNPKIEPDHAPVEHVIEIRTKREDHGAAKGRAIGDWQSQPYCEKPEDVIEYPSTCVESSCFSVYIPTRCVHVTRELWIDGVRFGVVKGLDQ